MKIALMTASLSRYGGGVSASVQALSQSLLAAKADVRVIGLDDRGWQSDWVQWNGSSVSCLRVVGPQSLGYAPDALDVVKRSSAEIVHSHGLWKYTSRVVTQWAAATGRPFVVSPHGMLDAWALKRAAWKKTIAARLFEDNHLRRAGCLHALCDSEAKAIRAFGLDNPVCVIPNGIALPEIDSGSPARLPTDLPLEGRVMLFIGRLHPKKNLAALIEAWPSAAENNGWHLVIAGWDQLGHADVLRALVRKRNLKHAIHIVGPLFGPEKDAVFRRADAFVLPSLSEGLPMAILEAWSYGLPVLQTDACNLPLGFEQNAAFRISTNASELARDIRTFMRLAPETQSAMGRNGRFLVEQKFCWSSVASQMLEVYAWLLEGGDPPEYVCVADRGSSRAA